jgi:hypothetical protein
MVNIGVMGQRSMLMTNGKWGQMSRPGCAYILGQRSKVGLGLCNRVGYR